MLGKHVGDEAVSEVLGERAKDVASLDRAPGDQRQPLEADHRVPAPVGKPVVARHDGSHFVSHGEGARDVAHTTGGPGDELIGRQDEVRAEPRAGTRLRRGEQPVASLDLGAPRPRVRKRPNRLP